MTVKFRIGLTIDAETLFHLISKMLPIDDLSVMELPPEKHTVAVHKIVHEPKRQINKRPSHGPNLKAGINGIVITALKDGPLRAVEIEPQIVAVGYSRNSVTSRLDELRKHKVIEQLNDGRWRLVHPEVKI